MNDALANTYRRLDHLMATGKSLPRATPVPIARPVGPRACRVCGVVDCASPEHFRTLLVRHRLDEHATAAARDAVTRQNGHGRA